MKIFEPKMKNIKRGGNLLMTVAVISLMGLTGREGFAEEPVPILELTIPDTARVVDSDNGVYVVVPPENAIQARTAVASGGLAGRYAAFGGVCMRSVGRFGTKTI